jgi:ligand-binding sensor domain-containing protein/serine phosphatase RsbU (regulator of sigma subunit)
LLLFILLKQLGDAQTFKKIGVEDGLPSSIVYDLKVDKHNRIWVATFGGGIACYDGLKFKVINEDIGLHNDLIRNIALDEINEKIYVGSQGAFNVITKDTILNLTNLLTDKNGTNVLLTSVVGNTIYASTQDGFATLINFKKTDLVKKVNASSFLFDDDNNLWLSTRNNLFIKLANGKLIDASAEYNIKIEGGGDVKKYKNYTVLATKTGLFVFKKRKLIKVINKKNGLPEDIVRCLLVDDTTLWIGTRTGLINTSDLEKFNLFDSKNGMDRCDIKCMCLDKNGLLWVGSSNAGIFKMIKSDIVKFTFNAQPLSFATDSKKNVYALTKNGIKIFNKDSNSFVNFVNLKGYDNLKIFCFDNNNAIYLTAGEKGFLKLIPPDKKTVFEYKLSQTDNPGMSLLKDNNTIWLGYKRRLLKYDTKSNKIDSVDNRKLHARYYQDIIKNGSEIWFATETGLSKYSNNIFSEISDRTIKNFPNGIVNSLESDKYGHIWIAADRGLFCLENNSVFSNYRKDFFPTNEISDIAIIDTFLFAATNKGLIQVAIKPKNNKNCTYQIINKRNGLNDFDLTNKAIFSDSTNIWIAHENGAYRYRPTNQLKISIPIYISNISNDYGSLAFKRSKNFINQIVDHSNTLNLDHNENDFIIEFNGINYNLLDNVYYSFRLVGLNSNWSVPSNETKAVYTNLNPGDYVFELSASTGKNNFGEIVSYKIHITPPFYQTWWFKTILVVFLLFIIYVLVQLRIRNIKRKNSLLETKVNIRTEELNLKSIELEKSNTELISKGKLITESLEYAKKIQESILPSQEYLNKHFYATASTAAIYLPKDIVSGDFYYAYKKENNNYFALVDCTGHGVPGALLSFSVNSILHGAIVNLNDFKQPAYILKKLIDGFSEIYIKGQDVKESFAISLVCYNESSKKIYFSGISQSILILTQNEIKEVKNQNSFLNANKFEFIDQEFTVEKGDRIYFYSDGFYDQKSEKTNKRIYKRGMVKQISETKALKLTEQVEALKNYFLSFKGNTPQVDDVTVFVIEIQ